MPGLLGATLILAGAMLVGRSALLLVGRGRPRRGPRPALVIAGPYRRMRNPICLGALTILVGATLATGSRVVAFGTVVVAVVAHAWIVLVEEPRLGERLGTAYAAYLRRVPRWVPSLGAPPADD